MTRKIEDDKDENGNSKVLKDGERLTVKMYAMDARSILEDGLPEGVHRPGYRYIATDSAAKARIDDAHAEYRRDLSNAWRTNDGQEGDACTAPDGTHGVLQFASGKLVCVPVGAATTPDSSKLLDEGWDAEDDRAQAYLEYDQMLQDAWRSK